MGESRLGAWSVVKGDDCQLAKLAGSNPIMLQELFCFPALSNGKVCIPVVGGFIFLSNQKLLPAHS